MIVDAPAGPLEVHDDGTGPVVVLLPSLGRGASDFSDLAARLVDAGHRALRPEPRGIGRSLVAPGPVTMIDLAADVAAVIGAAGESGAVIVGHAFGNRVARQTATRFPDLVDGVVLLACGGRVPGDAEAMAALVRVFDPTLSVAAHLDAVGTAFFAPGNDPGVWRDGWHAEVAGVQSAATRATPVDEWWDAGTAPVLVVQPGADRVAPAENARGIAAALGARATLVTIPGAGHALLPEQPDAVATTVVRWLRALRSER